MTKASAGFPPFSIFAKQMAYMETNIEIKQEFWETFSIEIWDKIFPNTSSYIYATHNI